MRDVRSPADPQDFETTMSQAAIPARDFRTKALGNDLIVEILEGTATGGRGGNTGYRVAFVPSSLIPNRTVRPDQLLALADLGDTVVFVPALNDGGRQRVTVANRSADRGWYLCVPVGQRGMLGEVSGLARGPWGL